MNRQALAIAGFWFLAVAVMALPTSASRLDAKGTATTLRSVESGEVIRFADEDIFRLLEPAGVSISSPRYWDPALSPTQLKREPPSIERAFEVRDEYWLELAQWHALPGSDASTPGYATALYYPSVRAAALESPQGKTFLFELDPARDRLIQRYVALFDKGVREPTFLDVLRVAREVRGEAIEVTLRVNGEYLVLDADQAERFWPAFVSMDERADLLPADFGEAGASGFHPWTGGYWPVHRDQDVRIEFTFPGERSVEYILLRPEGVVARAMLGWPSWPAFEPGDELLATVQELVGPPAVNHRANDSVDAATDPAGFESGTSSSFEIPDAHPTPRDPFAGTTEGRVTGYAIATGVATVLLLAIGWRLVRLRMRVN